MLTSFDFSKILPNSINGTETFFDYLLHNVLYVFLNAIIVSFIIYLLLVFTKIIVKRILKRVLIKVDEPRIDTISKILMSLLNYTFSIIIILTFLVKMGVEVSVIIAGAGAGAIIIGIAGREIIIDLISGFFIVVERYFDVGDYIATQNYEGYVVEIGVKKTILETFEKEKVIIPNAQIIDLKNFSNDKYVLFTEFTVDYSTDIKRLKELINQKLIPSILENEEVENPVYLGIGSLNESSITCSFSMEVNAYRRFAVKRFFNETVLLFCLENEIKIPFQTVQVHINE